MVSSSFDMFLNQCFGMIFIGYCSCFANGGVVLAVILGYFGVVSPFFYLFLSWSFGIGFYWLLLVFCKCW